MELDVRNSIRFVWEIGTVCIGIGGGSMLIGDRLIVGQRLKQ